MFENVRQTEKHCTMYIDKMRPKRNYRGNSNAAASKKTPLDKHFHVGLMYQKGNCKHKQILYNLEVHLLPGKYYINEDTTPINQPRISFPQ